MLSSAVVTQTTIYTLPNGSLATTDYLDTIAIMGLAAIVSMESRISAAIPSSINSIRDILSWQEAIASQFTSGVAPSWWSKIPETVQTWFTWHDLYAVDVGWNPTTTDTGTDMIAGEPVSQTGLNSEATYSVSINSGHMPLTRATNQGPPVSSVVLSIPPTPGIQITVSSTSQPTSPLSVASSGSSPTIAGTANAAPASTSSAIVSLGEPSPTQQGAVGSAQISEQHLIAIVVGAALPTVAVLAGVVILLLLRTMRSRPSPVSARQSWSSWWTSKKPDYNIAPYSSTEANRISQSTFASSPMTAEMTRAHAFELPASHSTFELPAP